jgi:15-cis-phytoene synthase
MRMDGFKLAKGITAKYGKTFYFASRFLKKEKQLAAYTVYAICRISDEAVDTSQKQLPSESLIALEQEIKSAYQNIRQMNSLLGAFQQTINKYAIPKQYFDFLIDGMRMDLHKARYKNFEELYDYCFKVAGAVGLIMIKIFGYTGPEAIDSAVNLGIAMQLTNILRDIKEDFNRGRIYLPEDEMRRFGVTESQISKSIINDNFKELMKFQIARSREYYANAYKGIKSLSELNSRLVVTAMAEIYAGILKEIEKNNYDIFSRRACVNTPKKISSVLKIVLNNRCRQINLR